MISGMSVASVKRGQTRQEFDLPGCAGSEKPNGPTGQAGRIEDWCN